MIGRWPLSSRDRLPCRFMRSQGLFSGGPLSDHFVRVLDSIQNEVSRLSINELADEEQAVRRLRDKYELKRLDLGEARTEVVDQPPNAVIINVQVPFTGSAHVLRLTPSSTTSNPPQGLVNDRPRDPFIQLQYGPVASNQLDSSTIRQWREQEVDKLRTWVTWANQDLEAFSAQCQEVARQVVSQRKQHLLRQQKLRDELS